MLQAVKIILLNDNKPSACAKAAADQVCPMGNLSRQVCLTCNLSGLVRRSLSAGGHFGLIRQLAE